MYRDNRTGVEYATLSDVRRARPDVSLPEEITDDVLAEQDFSIIAPAPQPEYDARSQTIAPAPAQLVDGVWTQTWVVVDMTPEQRMAKAKEIRKDAVANIQVTVTTGKVFNGDEVSQDRMARALITMDAIKATGTTWVLANNVPTTVTRDELFEALMLAGQEQIRLWVLPWA